MMLQGQEEQRLSVPKGWHDLYEKLMEQLEQVNPDLRIIQAKQKFGALRVYVDPFDEQAYPLIDEATKASGRMCEECGAAGQITVYNGYYAALCPTHQGDAKFPERHPSAHYRLIMKRSGDVQ